MIRRAIFLLFVFLTVSSAAFAQRIRTYTAPGAPPSTMTPPDKTKPHTDWSFLPLSATHADEFIRDHPTYDGRGVIIFIFDTGVDPGTPGLLTTSEGTRKIIDVRDFSGTGDVPYTPAVRIGDELRVNGNTVLKGLNSISANSIDGKYYYGALEEKRFQNGLEDLNFNGTGDDVFGVLVFMDSAGHYAAYLDSDGDRDLSNEHKITNYREHYDTFAFHSKDSTLSQGRRLNGAINIYPDRSIVSVYFDDGSHGTHVAGIASGHDIDNQPGFNGVAPGAEVFAVKFADNNAGGVTVSGSMQRAFELAAKTARSQMKPVVVNMSFGIGNELEGHAAMDKWLDSLLAATPNLTVCVSAGNEGPGLSSVGLPGSADRVISCGAALPDNAARDLYDLYTTHPVLFDFSSRGGELAKPDLVAPGTAVSTVPDYVIGDRYNGTSMSSPYSAGCAALLLSAMTQAFPDWTANAYEIKRAMMLSAQHIDGATPLDEGFGMIDVPAAFELLSKWERKKYVPVPCTVEARVPTIARTGTAAYFRAGTYPAEGGHEAFSVEPQEPAGASLRERALGMDAYDLVSDEPWMSPVQSSIYRRGATSMNVDVRYTAKLLETPGLYCGRIWAYSKGASHTRSNAQFELLNSIIVPYRFSDASDYRVTVPAIKLKPGSLERQFFAIPPGTRSVKVTIATSDRKGECSMELFDNDGKQFSRLGLPPGTMQRTAYFYGDQVTPGVWELDLSRTMSSEDEREATFDLTVEVQPLDVNATNAGFDPEGRPTLRATIANPTRNDYEAQPEAVVAGYERTIDTLITSGDSYVLPFSARENERGVIFNISIAPQDYDLFTDVACQVLKSDSVAVFNSAFDYASKVAAVMFKSEDAQDSSEDSTTDYLLYIRGALALPDRDHPWHLHIVELRYLQHQTFLSTPQDELILPPFTSQTLAFGANKRASAPPEGYRLFGNMDLKKNQQDLVRIPIVW